MSNVYIVISSEGEYEDYREYNEKAFYNKEDAEKYCKELDEKHNYKPEFITDKFEEAYEEAYNSLPDWDLKANSNEDLKTYYDNIIKQGEKDIQYIISEMNKQGFNVNEDMIEKYKEWESNLYYEWYPCKIEEIELI